MKEFSAFFAWRDAKIEEFASNRCKNDDNNVALNCIQLSDHVVSRISLERGHEFVTWHRQPTYRNVLLKLITGHSILTVCLLLLVLRIDDVQSFDQRIQLTRHVSAGCQHPAVWHSTCQNYRY